MKNFSEMSQEEIDNMSDKDFKAVSPFEKKSCYDCKYLEELVDLWCSNKEAIKARGTSIPGCIKCRFWQPDWEYINDKYKTKENGYETLIDKAINILSKTQFFKRFKRKQNKKLLFKILKILLLLIIPISFVSSIVLFIIGVQYPHGSLEKNNTLELSGYLAICFLVSTFCYIIIFKSNNKDDDNVGGGTLSSGTIGFMFIATR